MMDLSHQFLARTPGHDDGEEKLICRGYGIRTSDCGYLAKESGWHIQNCKDRSRAKGRQRKTGDIAEFRLRLLVSCVVCVGWDVVVREADRMMDGRKRFKRGLRGNL
jgi:hypothetical protein